MNKCKRILSMVAVLSMTLLSGCNQSTVQSPELVESKYDKLMYRPVAYEDIGDIVMYDAEIRSKREYYTINKQDVSFSYRVKSGDFVKKGDIIAEVLISEDTKSQITDLENTIASRKQSTERENKRLEYENQLNKLEIEHNKELIKEIESEEPQRENAKEEIKALKDSNQSLNTQIKSNKNTMDYNQSMCDLEVKNLNLQLVKVKSDLDAQYIKARADGKVCYISSKQMMHNGLVAIVEDTKTLYVSLPSEAEEVCKEAKVFGIVDGKKYELSRIYDDSPYATEAFKSGVNQPPMYEFIGDMPSTYKTGDHLIVYCITDYKEHVLTVYNDSIHSVKDAPYVYVYENGNKVRRDVSVGIRSKTKTEIVIGLKEGDLVCYESSVFPPEVVSETCQVTLGNVEEQVSVDGKKTVQSEYSYHLDTFQNQILASVKAQEGDIIKKGQVLFTYSIPGGDAEYAEAKNALVNAQSTYKLFEKDMQSQKKELKKQIENNKGYEKKKSKILLEQLETDYKYTKAEHKQQISDAKKFLDQVDATYFHVPVESEIDGFVIFSTITKELVGQKNLSSSEYGTPFITVKENNSGLKFSCNLFPSVRNYSKCTVTFDDGTTGTGYVTNVYNDGMARQYFYDERGNEIGWYEMELEAFFMVVLDNPEDEAKVNTNTKLSIATNSYQNVISIPKDYVIREDGMPFVWLQTDSGYVKQYVQVSGTVGEKQVIVLEGLSEGQTLALPE